MLQHAMILCNNSNNSSLFLNCKQYLIIQDNDGAVALHYAVAHSDLQLCKSLISSTTVRAVDTLGVHPLLIAGQRSSVPVRAIYFIIGQKNFCDIQVEQLFQNYFISLMEISAHFKRLI